MATIDHFECSKCGDRLSAAVTATVCPQDGALLYVHYDWVTSGKPVKPRLIPNAGNSMWRYADVLPSVNPVTLGEGMTPLLRSRKYPNLFIKDEGLNPTGSGEARGMSVAVSVAREHGRKGVAICCNWEGAVAAAAYSAAAGLKAKVFLRSDTPPSTLAEVAAFGADVEFVDDGERNCPDRIASSHPDGDWVDVSPFKEPFRVEGLKTIGYEIAEGLGGRVPDAVLCVHRDGLLPGAMRKAFVEMRQLGWIDPEKSTQFISIFINNNASNHKVIHQVSLTPGNPGGSTVEISGSEMMSGVKEMAAEDGVLSSPEGGAALVGYKSLLNCGVLKQSNEVVLINPASGYKYLASQGSAVHSRSELKLPASRNIGGIIGPY